MGMIFPPPFQPIPQKRRVFISYHHADQSWVNAFVQHFAGIYDVFSDRSLDQAIDSNDLTYVNRAISEKHITGTSLTIVLCGAETYNRKCVDWEIHSTLEKDHALLGMPLPHNNNGQGVWYAPDRLLANINSGYAHWIPWTIDAATLKLAIEHALSRSNQFFNLKDNRLPKMPRNR